eukprot:361631-Chlamydomonas_euryale.AAC.7
MDQQGLIDCNERQVPAWHWCSTALGSGRRLAHSQVFACLPASPARRDAAAIGTIGVEMFRRADMFACCSSAFRSTRGIAESPDLISWPCQSRSL